MWIRGSNGLAGNRKKNKRPTSAPEFTPSGLRPLEFLRPMHAGVKPSQMLLKRRHVAQEVERVGWSQTDRLRASECFEPVLRRNLSPAAEGLGGDNGSAGWADEADSSRGRGEASRDFAKLYELDSDPNRKDFLDDLFTFMQKRGTPVNRIPIMAKQVLDLYKLYKLVTEKGGLVEVINKKIWREITKGLNLPTSITSAAFTLRTQYMKYLYPYECERKGLSSPGELQAAIDSNRREGRRPSYSSSLFRFSPSPSTAPHILSGPKMHLSALGIGASGALNGLQSSAGPSLKKEDLASSMLGVRSNMAMALGQQQVAGLARAATLEQLREKLETGGGEGPERKMARLAEEQQRLMQQAFQHNLLAMASQVPMNLRLAAPSITTRGPSHEKPQDMSLSISTNGNASITVSVEVNGTLYSGWYTTPKQHTTHSLWLTHEALNRCRGQALNRAASS
ncbi:unnamed protein product [Arctogadus glacialis]